MSRGPIFIESRVDEGGRSCHEIAAVALQALKNALEFVRGAAMAEGKADYPEFRALLKALEKPSRATLGYCELWWTASAVFGVTKRKMLQILKDFELECEDDIAGAYDKAIRALRKSNPGSSEGQEVSGPLPSCYFDPSDSVTESGYTMGAPFYGLVLNETTWRIVQWLGVVANFRDSHFLRRWVPLDVRVRSKWFEATVADALMRLPNGCNEKDVWKVLKANGIKIESAMKKAIIKHLKGDTFDYRRMKRDPQRWKFDQEVFDAASERWADKWADVFAKELNNSEQGIVRYGNNTSTKPDLNTQSSSVERWIRRNTIFNVRYPAHQFVGPHGQFIKILETYCQTQWYTDIHLAIRRFLCHNELENLEETSWGSSLLSSLIRSGVLPESGKALESELKGLGLTFTEPVMKEIIESLTNKSAFSLTGHVFQVDPALVVQHAASQIRAVFSPSQRSNPSKRLFN